MSGAPGVRRALNKYREEMIEFDNQFGEGEDTRERSIEGLG